IRKGDKIVIWGNNTLPLLVAFLGVINSRAVVVPLDEMFTPDMVNRIAEKVHPKLVVSSMNNQLFLKRFPFFSLETIEERLHGYPIKSFKKPSIRESDLVEIVFTSGTTTEPKGVMIRHRNIISLLPPIRDVIGSLRHVISRFLIFFRFHRRVGLTFLAIAVGGAKLDREIFEFYRRLGFAVYQGYGMTETSPFITIFNPLKDKKGSIGKVIGDQKIKIADNGEILVRGSNVSDGYFEDDAATAASFQNGWLRTGDIGRLDEKGNLYFLGRKKDMIVTSDGINIYPEAIESVLKSISGVKDTTVVGIAKNGEDQVVALLILKPGSYSGSDIIRQANAVLAPSHRIKKFHIWPEP
ncbi:MAG: AMP-binding protein, partial [Desulfobacterales bacterium]